METILLIIVMGVMNLLAFVIGARTSQKAQKDEEIKLPSINPMEIAKEHRERKQAEIEQAKYDVMLENINNYSGDGTGQKDIPR